MSNNSEFLTCRKAFEQRLLCLGKRVPSRKEDDGRYLCPNTEGQWRSWKYLWKEGVGTQEFLQSQIELLDEKLNKAQAKLAFYEKEFRAIGRQDIEFLADQNAINITRMQETSA